MNAANKFSINLVVSDNDIDQLGHANNVVYLRWAQDVAAAHWNNIANESVQKEMIWVVLRHEIDYKKQALAGETLLLYTWVTDAEGVRSTRHVEICNAKGEIVALVKTTWCLVDPVTRRPKRIPDEIKKLFIPDI
jgi:acyl-CoA thioester hydrolase